MVYEKLMVRCSGTNVTNLWSALFLECEMSDSEDDCPRLSREALTALQEFYTQQAEKDKNFRSILAGKESSLQRIQFDEDWVCHYPVFCNYVTI